MPLAEAAVIYGSLGAFFDLPCFFDRCFFSGERQWVHVPDPARDGVSCLLDRATLRSDLQQRSVLGAQAET